jgi:osmotically-inducible protein OsmY
VEVQIMIGNRLLTGAAVGMAIAYLFDPNRGTRRRALAMDQMRRASRKTRDAVDATMRDVSNRTAGVVAATRGRFAHDEVDDVTLLERVRAKLGRACSHPRAIDVEALDGAVTLRGPILASELERVLATTAAVRGVRSVSNELQPHESAEGVPSLQGQGSVGESTLDILQTNWAPATQALVAAAGLAATGLCVAAYARR